MCCHAKDPALDYDHSQTEVNCSDGIVFCSTVNVSKMGCIFCDVVKNSPAQIDRFTFAERTTHGRQARTNEFVF